ncbi:MAG: UDP-N-acetylglucosamine 1-carboxyvinyltransferase [Candidatus Levybacteria bacterium RIFCSPHIGHO2_02_FULL_37_13]|nr:MAG: UDP-N-acetylglucosamine 1-carboxyvinyltransferase [Candidatus Levybacteria bacterium RIFCSPHIGHO2_02_FULL_37_13]OGH39470.1 MAG: UDP-N-acetylglucosamine 1-carboxyvinyltransferase [Candidatus Levybacteria bacterium RIFCSPLOWO2_01_FULL_37_26]
MDKLVINGGKKLKGTISVSGAKNVALKALVAACLTDEKVIIKNVPLISDFMVMVAIIRELGGEVEIENHIATIQMKKFKKEKISLDEGAKIRTSAMFMAPLLARLGVAIIPNPGGCRIGARPIDRTIKGIKELGVDVRYNSKDGYFYLKRDKNKEKEWRKVIHKFDKSTHTGTEIMILASTLFNGETVLVNAAEEPEIDELISLLVAMGAKIARTGKREITIDGVDKLHGATYTIGPDRNEVVTFAIAAMVTKGDIFVKDVHNVDFEEFLKMLEAAGGGIEKRRDGIRFYYKGNLKKTDVTTSFYPGFMTDWQGPWAVLMTRATGESTIHETVYESRFGYVKELRKMGANISFFNPKIKDPEKIYNFNLADRVPDYYHAIKVKGQTKLHNAVVEISDLRAGATLVLAALTSEGESVIFGVEHLDRGYEEFEKRLSTLGAEVKRIKNE